MPLVGREQNRIMGKRGRQGDPLYDARRLLTAGAENLNDEASKKLDRLLDEGDPCGEVRDAWHAKEALREVCQLNTPENSATNVEELIEIFLDPSFSPEINKLGNMLKRWKTQIINLCISMVSNGPTESVNNLIKYIKRTGRGFTNFTNYSTRLLLYAGKPNITLLHTITLH